MMAKLTPEQEALIPIVKQEWLDKLFKPESRLKLDRDKATTGIQWLYKMAELQPVPIIFAKSPNECQIIANLCQDAEWFKQSQINGEDWIRQQASDPNNIKKAKSYYAFAYETFLFRAGWCAFYDYFTRIGVINDDNFNKYKIYIEAGVGFAIFFDEVAIVCGLMDEIKTDDQGRLHGDGEPAAIWSDGYRNWFWHGVAINEQYAKRQINRDDILKEKNVEVRRAIMEMLGPTSSVHPPLFQRRPTTSRRPSSTTDGPVDVSRLDTI